MISKWKIHRKLWLVILNTGNLQDKDTSNWVAHSQTEDQAWNFNSGETSLLDSNRSSYFHVPDNTKQSVYEEIEIKSCGQLYLTFYKCKITKNHITLTSVLNFTAGYNNFITSI